MPNLIDPDQVGFIAGRQAPDATQKIVNRIHYADMTKTPTTFLTLDAEKTFDRIHWGYLRHTLSKFIFRGNILSAILALYTAPLAQVLTDGILSDTVNSISVMELGKGGPCHLLYSPF